MNWFVYILFCDQKIYYVGFTNNLVRRVKEHKLKRSIYTSKFSDIHLVYYEKFNQQKMAERREKQIKGWSRAKKKALIERDIPKIVNLSRSTEFVEV